MVSVAHSSVQVAPSPPWKSGQSPQLYPTPGAGVSVQLDNGTVKSARVALGAVAPTPLLVSEAAAALEGKAPTAENIQAASEKARDAARPINDMRGTIEFRKHLCEVLTRRALTTAVERAQEAR